MTDIVDDKEMPSDEEAMAIANDEFARQEKAAIEAPEMPIGYGIDVCRQWALNRLKHIHADALRRKMGNPSPEERDTYERQVRAAEAVLAGSQSDAQTLMLNMLKRDDESVANLAIRIAGKSQAGDLLIGVLGGAKRKDDAAVETATTVESIAEVMDGAAAAISAAEARYDQMLAEAMAAASEQPAG